MPGTVTVIGMNGGKEVFRQVVETPGIAVRLAFEQEEQEITLPRADTDREENQPQPYRMLCKVRAFDAEGCPVFRESAKVTVVVEGPARLIGVDNGDIKLSLIHIFVPWKLAEYLSCRQIYLANI